MAHGMARSGGYRVLSSSHAQLCSRVPSLEVFGFICSLLLCVESLQLLSSRECGCSL